MNKKLFFVGLILAASGLLSPQLALLGGLLYGLALSHPFHVESRQLAKFLLQASVVALGFGMNLHEVLQAGRTGLLYTALSISLAVLLGLGLGYLIKVNKKSSFLISAGTAICGSAIAAVGPIASQRRRDGRFTGDCFYPEFRGAFAVSDDWIGFAYEPDAIWVVVGAGDSRHQFG